MAPISTGRFPGRTVKITVIVRETLVYLIMLLIKTRDQLDY